LAIGATGAVAAGASAATLQVSVTPASIHTTKKFRVKITGTYTKSELTGKAFLVSFIQYSLKPCKADAAHELSAYGEDPFTDQNTGRSPFGWKFTFTAGGPGVRRVCAYLYPKHVGPADKVRPLTRATATYRVQS